VGASDPIDREDPLYDEKAVELLIERKAIEDLMHRYVWSVDAKDYSGLRATLADDAIAHFPDVPEIRGAGNIVKWIQERCADLGSSHRLVHVYNVDVDSKLSKANVLSYQIAHYVRRDDPDTVLSVDARSHDLVTQVDGKWKIFEKNMERGWVETRHHPQAAASKQEVALNLGAWERSGAGG